MQLFDNYARLYMLDVECFTVFNI